MVCALAISLYASRGASPWFAKLRIYLVGIYLYSVLQWVGNSFELTSTISSTSPAQFTNDTMPHSESPGSSPPVPTPTSEEMEEMEHDAAQDVPVKTEPQDETDGDITMADVNPMPPPQDTKKDAKLEELFADDSDEEFPSTGGKASQSQTLPTSSPGPDSSAEQK